jgi:hypothetical protein
VWLWATIPLAVTALVHPAAQYEPLWTAPFFVASAVFVTSLYQQP